MEILDLRNMVFEYCWNEDVDLKELCTYGDYEKVSDYLEKYINAFNAKEANSSLGCFFANNPGWNNVFQIVCSMGYMKMAILFMNGYEEINNMFSIVQYNTKYCLDWKHAFVAANSQGTKELADMLFNKMEEYDNCAKEKSLLKKGTQKDPKENKKSPLENEK